jgi:peroxiredoxin
VTRPRNLKWRWPAAAVTVVLLLGGCGASSSDNLGYISGDGTVEQIAPSKRTTLPPVTGELLDGGTFDSADYTGQVLVYNVWGSWCPPCRDEASHLQRAWEETQNQGVQFVGIDVKDNDAAARAFEREYGVTYPSINSEDSASALLAFSGTLPPNAVPSTVVVDPQGRVAARVVGKTTYSTLIALVNDVLPEGAEPRRDGPGPSGTES